VWSEHLEPAFEAAYARRGARALPWIHGVTLKAARFLQANAYVQHKPPSAVVHRVGQLLLEQGRTRDGAFGHSISRPYSEVNLAATVESVFALEANALGQDVIRNAIRTVLLPRAKLDLKSDNPLEAERIVALYSLSEMFHHLRSSVRRRLDRSLAALLCIVPSELPLYMDKFRNCNHKNDYYSFSPWLLLLRAALNVAMKYPDRTECVHLILPMVLNVLGAFSRDAVFRSGGQIQFWENYHALLVLRQCDALFGDTSIKEDAYMYVRPIHFATTRLVVDPSLAVVLMPFRPRWSDDMFGQYKQALARCGMTAWRSDREFKDDIIMQTIWENINRARFVVADCTGRNPNVFYELGIAHTLGKRVFITAQRSKDIPFDLLHIRSTEYGLEQSRLTAMKNSLVKFSKELP
jgi:hypothetical protein